MDSAVWERARQGVERGDHRQVLRSHPLCFESKALLDWMVLDGKSRSEALVLCERARVAGYLHHVTLEHRFKGATLLFRFKEDHNVAEMKRAHLNVGDELVCGEQDAAAAVATFNDLVRSIMDEFAQYNGVCFDYEAFKASEVFTAYKEAAMQLQTVDPAPLSDSQKTAFFINLYNMITIHGMIERPRPDGDMGRAKWFANTRYMIGGMTLSLDDIENGILRCNARAPYNPLRPLNENDDRLSYCPSRRDYRIHFGLNCGAISCPPLHAYSSEHLRKELDATAAQFCNQYVTVDGSGIVISILFYWFRKDFPRDDRELVNLLLKYMDEEHRDPIEKILLLPKLPKLHYTSYDWSLNDLK